MQKKTIEIKTTIPGASAYNAQAKVFTQQSPQEGCADIYILWKGPVYQDPKTGAVIAKPRRFKLDTVPIEEADRYIVNLVVDIVYIEVGTKGETED